MDVIADLVSTVDALARAQGRVCIAVDGPDAAGKTTFADAVAGRLHVPAVRASVDAWHHPAALRRRRGSLSAEGYYRDAFDHTALTEHLVRPFLAGAPAVQTDWFDHRLDQRVDAPPHSVPATAALVLDGVFLLRPELRDVWTLSVYLHVPEEVTVRRALVRDAGLFGGADAVRLRYAFRYLPGQALYRAEARPEAWADVVVDNSEPRAPVRRR